MRILLFFTVSVLLTAFSLMSTGSPLNSSLHSPRLNDSIIMYEFNARYSNADSGSYCLWDFSSVETSKRRLTARIDSFADRPGKWVCVFNGIRYYFLPNLNEATFSYMGYEQQGELSDVKKPFVTLYSEPSYGTVTSGTLLSTGLLYENFSTAAFGKWQSGCKASGTLITPDADTLTNVYRVDSKFVIIKRIFPKDSIIQLSETNCLYDTLECSEQSAMTIHESRWYAPGYRYPIIFASDHPLYGAHHYFSSLNEMCELYDPDNEEKRQLHDHVEAHSNNSEIISSEIITYTFHQHRATKTITVDFATSEDAEVMFIISDISGIVYKSLKRRAQAGDNCKVTINYQDLPHAGAYALYISVGAERRQEKFNC